jgi:hypothetical protein
MCRTAELVGCLIFSLSGPSKSSLLPPVSWPGFPVVPAKALVKFGLAVSGICCSIILLEASDPALHLLGAEPQREALEELPLLITTSE